MVEMKNSFIQISLIIIFIFAISLVNSYAQFNDYTIKLGVQANALLSDTEFDKELRPSNAEYNFSGLGRLFLRFELFTEILEAEVGGGFGRLAGVDTENKNWWTYIIPFDVRLILSPFEMEVWNPYLYGGAGGMSRLNLANASRKNAICLSASSTMSIRRRSRSARIGFLGWGITAGRPTSNYAT